MAADGIEKTCNRSMDKVIEFFKEELRGVRTGRASPGLVEHLKIEVASYGSTMELRELAAISAPEPALLLVKPFDPGVISDIEKGIQSSDIGITPACDGKTIRLPIPALSGERRNQLIQQVRKMAEQQKIALRNVRRDTNKTIDAAKKDSTLSEDEAADLKDSVQKAIKKHETAVDELTSAKTKEIESN